MRSNLAIALLCLLLGAALADWLSTRDAHAQALPPSGGADECTDQACTVSSLTSSGAISGTTGAFSGTITSSVSSGGTALICQAGAKINLGGGNTIEASGTAAFFVQDIAANGSIASQSGFKGTGTAPVGLFSTVANGATAIAVQSYSQNNLTTAGAVIEQWYNNGGATTLARMTHFGGFQLVGMTTAARDALAGADLREGTIIYNTTTKKLNFYSGTAWEAVTSI